MKTKWRTGVIMIIVTVSWSTQLLGGVHVLEEKSLRVLLCLVLWQVSKTSQTHHWILVVVWQDRSRRVLL